MTFAQAHQLLSPVTASLPACQPLVLLCLDAHPHNTQSWSCLSLAENPQLPSQCSWGPPKLLDIASKVLLYSTALSLPICLKITPACLWHAALPLPHALLVAFCLKELLLPSRVSFLVAFFREFGILQ
jgi:hypothetical protein